MMRDRWGFASFVLGLTTLCVAGLASGHHLVGIEAAVAVGGGVGLVALALRAFRHGRLVRGLRSLSVPAEVAGVRVRLARLEDAAFVAGLSRPTIFCDRELPEQLTEGELRAVLLHEQGHQRAADPARLLLLEIVAPVARRCTLGRQWLMALVARREIAADRKALADGASRADLASAMLRLPPMAGNQVAGFGQAVDLRLRALLGEEPDPTVPAPIRRLALLLAGGLLGTALCAWFLHQLAF